MATLNEIAELLQGDPELDEIPVDVRTFVTSPDFLNQPALSDIQYTMVEVMSQIYKLETLQRIDPKHGKEHYEKYTKNEIVLQLGKGSGKDHTSTIAVAYVTYKLLCLKDPSAYYGKPSNDPIDIINIAINAQQARTVFFNRFKSIVERSPWFAGKYDSKRDYIEFDKHVSVYSGHSERESHEGLNLIVSVLDEISGFALEASSETGKTAQAIYDMFRGSVDSRFPGLGKVVLLSFPRFDGDFITQHYEEVVAAKNIIAFEHEFVIDDTLPYDNEDNRFSIEWEEDEIVAYRLPNVFALKKPTWKVNPTIELESLKSAFFRNPADALSRFACMPLSPEGSFFRYPDRLNDAFVRPHPITDRRLLSWEWEPVEGREYFLHVDLAQQVDKCAIAISYVDRWVKPKHEGIQAKPRPHVVTEMIAFWEPQREGPVDFKEVKEWILALRARGTNIKICTFDRWNSFDMIQELRKYGVRAETLSVKREHYEDFALLIYEERFQGPDLPEIVKEMTALKLIKDKVDHPRTGYKDLSDAVVGSVFNALRLARRSDAVVEIYDMKPQRKKIKQQEVYEPPKADETTLQWLRNMQVI